LHGQSDPQPEPLLVELSVRTLDPLPVRQLHRWLVRQLVSRFDRLSSLQLSRLSVLLFGRQSEGVEYAGKGKEE
jgi:hypothetical protein